LPCDPSRAKSLGRILRLNEPKAPPPYQRGGRRHWSSAITPLGGWDHLLDWSGAARQGVALSLLRIPYETEGFPAGTVANGSDELSVTWDDVLWAAVTVGRPSRHYVFQHGDASAYEALFRWSLLRMALEQSSIAAYRLRRTSAARTLDPTEKGAVNYFLGMTFCKLFAAKLLETPWLLHLDVFRPQMNPVLTGRSRPDLIGVQTGTGQWHGFECKGRVSQPGATAKSKAKDQALRLVSVNGTPCTLHVGAITYYRNDVLQFYWCDPAPRERNGIDVRIAANAWRHYYAPVVHLIHDADRRGAMQREAGVFVAVEGLDLEVSIHPAVAELLVNEQWAAAQRVAMDAASDFAGAGYQPDGLWVKTGESWRRRSEDSVLLEG